VRRLDLLPGGKRLGEPPVGVGVLARMTERTSHERVGPGRRRVVLGLLPELGPEALDEEAAADGAAHERACGRLDPDAQHRGAVGLELVRARERQGGVLEARDVPAHERAEEDDAPVAGGLEVGENPLPGLAQAVDPGTRAAVPARDVTELVGEDCAQLFGEETLEERQADNERVPVRADDPQAWRLRDGSVEASVHPHGVEPGSTQLVAKLLQEPEQLRCLPAGETDPVGRRKRHPESTQDDEGERDERDRDPDQGGDARREEKRGDGDDQQAGEDPEDVGVAEERQGENAERQAGSRLRLRKGGRGPHDLRVGRRATGVNPRTGAWPEV
jgi:hypothetical protein